MTQDEIDAKVKMEDLEKKVAALTKRVEALEAPAPEAEEKPEEEAPAPEAEEKPEEEAPAPEA